jgi:hypothetical protein
MRQNVADIEFTHSGVVYENDSTQYDQNLRIEIRSQYDESFHASLFQILTFVVTMKQSSSRSANATLEIDERVRLSASSIRTGPASQACVNEQSQE